MAEVSAVVPILTRAITDSLGAFDQTLKAIGLAVLGIVITALIVFRIRGWQGLKKHLFENIVISLGGGLATWLLVFVIIFYRLPFKMLNESNANLAQVIQEKRQLSERIDALNARIHSAPEKTRVVKVQEPCKLTEEQINPALAPQPCPGAPPPTLRDRVLAIIAHLTESDRNRFSNALSEFSESLSQGETLGYKLNSELGSLNRAEGDGTIAKDVQAHEKVLGEISVEGWKYQKSFPALRTKWDMFREQVTYIFGDNPDNEGPNAIINGAEAYRNYLEWWNVIPNTYKAQTPILNLLRTEHNEPQRYLNIFFTWQRGCVTRLNEMRNSIR